jgi:hypothetical protein
MHFEKESAVHKALEKFARKLRELQVPYAIAGGMALFFHGYRRFTEDIGVLVAPEGLKAIEHHLHGLGYVRPFAGSNSLRDAEFGVRIEFLIAGHYPGDGKPKPVSFPRPEGAMVEIEGIPFLRLAVLIELKLASGAAPGRRKDLGDVQELIRILHLPEGFSQQLNPSVRNMYQALWTEVQNTPPNP